MSFEEYVDTLENDLEFRSLIFRTETSEYIENFFTLIIQNKMVRDTLLKDPPEKYDEMCGRIKRNGKLAAYLGRHGHLLKYLFAGHSGFSYVTPSNTLFKAIERVLDLG